jgi:nifR3 family TIM-barrel protein
VGDDPLRRPLAIGALTVDRRLFMAPMAGITTPAFRASVRRWGAGLVYTEMVSACGLHYGDRRTRTYIDLSRDEHPVAVQLFAADPEVLADAAAQCAAAGADLVDINMACPVRKVVKTGAGAAMLAEPQRAAAAVAAVRRALAAAADRPVPVTAKLRRGLREGDELWREVAPRLVEAGAAALCIHPRTAAQLYRGAADHAVTEALARLVPVPVLASGDVRDRATALDLLGRGAAAVMLARHAVGAPWRFAQVLGEPEPGAAATRDEVRRFAADVLNEMGRRAVGHLRQFWTRFRKSGALDKTAALALMQAASPEELAALLGLRRRADGGWEA